MLQGKLSEAMKGLLQLLKEYQLKTRKKIKVVFDGKKEEGLDLRSERSGKIDVYYSLDYSADFLIMQFIKKDPHPRLTTVVTSDKEILFFVNRFKTPRLTSEDFAEIVNEVLTPEEPGPPEKDVDIKLSKEDISFWEKMFKAKNK
jgi:predicted RNA-binding protein with PIN domain